MVKELEQLAASEVELMMKAPLLVCILIAGADNNIDNKEIKAAIDLAKKGKAKLSLSEFYQEVSEDFEDKLKILLELIPKDSAGRTATIKDDLARLNPILKKLKKSFAQDFYTSLKYIAKKTAESSGGMLGMKTVGEEEMQFLTLSMIADPSS